MLKYHIQTVEVGSGGAATIRFNSIPQTYDDLFLTISARGSSASNNGAILLSVNGDNSYTNGSTRWLQGNGASSSSSNATFAVSGIMNGANSTANTFGNGQIYISNYRSSIAKSISQDWVTEENATQAFQRLTTGIWNGTSPINTMSLITDHPLFLQNTSVSLYGIRRGSDGKTEAASGGVITTSGGYTIHTFNTSGTFVANRNLNVDYLVVAGGGGGGQAIAYIGDNGGGGAGGLRSTVGSTGGGGSLESTLSLTSGSSYVVTVGSGGAIRTRGGNSSFNGIVSEGGGFGGPEQDNGISGNGGDGGSGGGSGNRWIFGIPSGGTGTINQGFGGGKSTTDAENSGGGGGGAGSVGSDANGATVVGNGIPGNGGSGVSVSISGTSIPYAGGGGGGTRHATQSTGGLGGGGRGNSSGAASTPGSANTGGGGGGAGTNGVASAGGSGVVIIRYLTP